MPAAPGHLTQALVEAVVRHQQTHVVGERRLGDHHCHLTARERALHSVEVVERHDERPGGDVVRQAVLLRHQAAVLDLDQDFVEVAVVLAVEEQHLLPAGHGPGDPDDLGVGARRRQRELPHREAVAPHQFARDPDRVLGRQQVLRSEGHLPAHRLHHRGRAVAGEHGHVGDVEVGVLVAVDVAQTGSGRRLDEQRRVVVRRAQPAHRYAVRHHRLPGGPQRLATRTHPHKGGVLALLEPSDPGRVHSRSAHAPQGKAPRWRIMRRLRRRPSALSSLRSTEMPG